jgi:hypothetical protein
MTKLRPRRRTTIEPSFDLSDFSEFLAFIAPPAAELITSRAAEERSRGVGNGSHLVGIPPAVGAPRGELVRMPGGHYAPFLGGHELSVAAEIEFLQRILVERSSPDSGISPG